MNSQRRGVPSRDAEAVERRKWYEDLRKVGGEEGDKRAAEETKEAR